MRIKTNILSVVAVIALTAILTATGCSATDNHDERETQENSADDEKTIEYGIEIDKTPFEYDEDSDTYFIENLIETLSGVISNAEAVEECSIEITNESGFTVLEREIEPKENFVIDNFGLVIGENNLTIRVRYENGKVRKEKVCIYNLNEDNMNNLDIDYSDADEDGLNAFIEEMYGTNPNKADTDGDGVPDYAELVELGTDPNKMDSDDNGINDGDEDADGDKLTNYEEYLAGTLNYVMYSDRDSLNDYEEVKVYMTDPMNPDTDGDGMTDGWEINNEYDPKVYNETISSNDTCELSSRKVELNYEVSGKYMESYFMWFHDFDDIGLTSKIPSLYLQKAVDIELEGEFIKAELKFYFDEEFLADDVIPTIYMYDDRTCEFTPVLTNWDGASNYATAQIKKGGTYLLLNYYEE